MDRRAWWATVHGIPEESATTWQLINNNNNSNVGEKLGGYTSETKLANMLIIVEGR